MVGPSENFLLVHGAWHGGWVWDRVSAILESHGHETIAPTLEGMEQGKPTRPGIDLRCHTNQINRLLGEQQQPVVLVGWSYGGVLITEAASHWPEKVTRMVYIDAYVPDHGHSILDYQDSRRTERIEGFLASTGLLPPASMRTLGVQDPEIAGWLKPRLKDQPILTWTQPVRLAGPLPAVPTVYVRCTQPALPQFQQFQDRAQARPGWQVVELSEGHACPITAPVALSRILMQEPAD